MLHVVSNSAAAEGFLAAIFFFSSYLRHLGSLSRQGIRDFSMLFTMLHMRHACSVYIIGKIPLRYLRSCMYTTFFCMSVYVDIAYLDKIQSVDIISCVLYSAVYFNSQT